MRTGAPIRIVVHWPETEAGKRELPVGQRMCMRILCSAPFAVLAPGDHDHILSGVFNQFLSANPRASRINKKSANNPALID